MNPNFEENKKKTMKNVNNYSVCLVAHLLSMTEDMKNQIL